MKQLIVGLGNPGKRYEGTRHNVGFAVVDVWAADAGATWVEKPAWNTELAELPDGIVLAKPTTYMNDSGRAVAALAHYFKLKPEQISIIVDDRDLPFGTVKWRDGIRTGASHNGLRSIVQLYGGVPRLRIGVGNDIMRHRDLKDFVLDHFSAHEREELPEIISEAITLLKKKTA